MGTRPGPNGPHLRPGELVGALHDREERPLRPVQAPLLARLEWAAFHARQRLASRIYRAMTGQWPCDCLTRRPAA